MEEKARESAARMSTRSFIYSALKKQSLGIRDAHAGRGDSQAPTRERHAAPACPRCRTKMKPWPLWGVKRSKGR